MLDAWLASSSETSQPGATILMLLIGRRCVPSLNLANTGPDGWPRETRCSCNGANAATPEGQCFRCRPMSAALLIEHWPNPSILLRDQFFRIRTHVLSTADLEMLFPDAA